MFRSTVIVAVVSPGRKPPTGEFFPVMWREGQTGAGRSGGTEWSSGVIQGGMSVRVPCETRAPRLEEREQGRQWPGTSLENTQAQRVGELFTVRGWKCEGSSAYFVEKSSQKNVAESHRVK